MSIPRLPPELLDHVVDLLHDKKHTLQNCCLVSKSWIPRTRKHLFAKIALSSPNSLRSWKKLFPDPSSSPAYYTHTLSVTCYPATAVPCDWIKAFSRVVCFVFTLRAHDVHEPAVSLVPFYGFSPMITFLRVFLPVLPSSQVFDLIFSFPLLEDLQVISYRIQIDDGDDSDELSTVVHHPNPPVFTGSLGLWAGVMLKLIVNRLLSLQDLRFRLLTLLLIHEEDLSSAKALVNGCSNTLESLDITCSHNCTYVHISTHTKSSFSFLGTFVSVSIDLSKAGKLKDATFIVKQPDPKWALMALQTVTDDQQNLQQITLHLPLVLLHPTSYRADPADVELAIGETAYQHWLELDHFLTQFLESRSIYLEVVLPASSRGAIEGQNGCVDSLLPEVMRRGMADLVERRR